MPELESPLPIRHLTNDIPPRQPLQEIAELLAAAILRMRAKRCDISFKNSEVCLGFPAIQRVNTNPSYT